MAPVEASYRAPHSYRSCILHFPGLRSHPLPGDNRLLHHSGEVLRPQAAAHSLRFSALANLRELAVLVLHYCQIHLGLPFSAFAALSFAPPSNLYLSSTLVFESQDSAVPEDWSSGAYCLLH